MVPNPVTQAIALVNQISQLLLSTVIPVFDITLCHPLRTQHLLMLLQINQVAVIVIKILSTLHGERRKCLWLILDGKIGRVLSSSFWMTATSCLPDIELEFIVFFYIWYLYFVITYLGSHVVST